MPLPRPIDRAARATRLAACAGVVLAVLCAGTSASAQSLSPSAVGARTDSARATPTDEGWHLEQCMLGIDVWRAAQAGRGVSAGACCTNRTTARTYCALAVAKLGFGGGQGSLGMGTSFAPWGTGVMLTGNVLRTFSAPLEATPRRTYVGASLHLWPAFALGGEIGYFWRMGDAPGESTAGKKIWSWSAGFGF